MTESPTHINCPSQDLLVIVSDADGAMWFRNWDVLPSSETTRVHHTITRAMSFFEASLFSVT